MCRYEVSKERENFDAWRRLSATAEIQSSFSTIVETHGKFCDMGWDRAYWGDAYLRMCELVGVWG